MEETNEESVSTSAPTSQQWSDLLAAIRSGDSGKVERLLVGPHANKLATMKVWQFLILREEMIFIHHQCIILIFFEAHLTVLIWFQILLHIFHIHFLPVDLIEWLRCDFLCSRISQS